MPELSEVKIMAEFINYVQQKESFFNRMKKSNVTKVNTEDDPFQGGVFTLSAQARGKELMLTLEQVGGSLEVSSHQKKLLCTMGMVGNWIYIRKDAPQINAALKHAHLRFQSTRGNWLLLFDVRRFAKWKWVDTWSSKRGACPLTEYDLFRENLLTNFWSHKDFHKPLCEVLLNQKWFNGIGNYVRAEVLYRLDINPFQPACQLTMGELNQLTTIIHLTFREAYQIGGGQMSEWFSPFGTKARDFDEWFQCYGDKQMLKIKDKSRRFFWFDPKWKSKAEEKYPQEISKKV
jgi:endonuclease VIII-like 1